MTKIDRINLYAKKGIKISFRGKKKNGKSISRTGFVKEVVADDRMLYYDIKRGGIRCMKIKNIKNIKKKG